MNQIEELAGRLRVSYRERFKPHLEKLWADLRQRHGARCVADQVRFATAVAVLPKLVAAAERRGIWGTELLVFEMLVPGIVVEVTEEWLKARLEEEAAHDER